MPFLRAAKVCYFSHYCKQQKTTILPTIFARKTPKTVLPILQSKQKKKLTFTMPVYNNQSTKCFFDINQQQYYNMQYLYYRLKPKMLFLDVNKNGFKIC